MDKLTHINEQGRAKMVDVSAKNSTKRVAVVRGEIKMKPETLERIAAGGIAKGDVLAVAQVAGVMAAKDTARLIPMCHPLFLTSVDIKFDLDREQSLVEIEATVGTTGQTGVEMEALTAASVAALTIYDMCKAVDKDMVIGNIRLMEKAGGKSGHYLRGEREGSNEQE
ncbi:cyclic pyranopterin monophosphate synthase MoaC [Dethiobacter alkaliphilus]|uniref:Cyclic pyranopterin monophosphate synthase n=1 Tax=Dethiobacter alkaliphilus AHT 1 TaxID=555088 RepID=C0GEX9_DETAL|nr:cyclic pyranopterin monophosphate synthase MoaC [Dethiobacter alkaliphilus]EEG78161.1 molybdenum cofactor biosynthesis protein C [Dethiobacter alkaliphilus AHT 1]